MLLSFQAFNGSFSGSQRLISELSAVPFLLSILWVVNNIGPSLTLRRPYLKRWFPSDPLPDNTKTSNSLTYCGRNISLFKSLKVVFPPLDSFPFTSSHPQQNKEVYFPGEVRVIGEISSDLYRYHGVTF